jgi:uroporphyrinogen III methyltransferase/synthase
MKKGIVYLVGAGPGDPGLLTRKGLDCLARADVVIYDHLINPSLLDAAPPAAERIYAGKEAAKHALKQEEVNRLLVTKAKEGKYVVRLKGGDPFVLGRGGEEAEALQRAGIPFEIVPGVTSAVAVPAYAGIPVTHRGTASSFAVITGHEDPRKAASSLDWEKLAQGGDTLVFLMGLKNLPLIVSELKKHGRSADTPAAVIQDGTLPGQKTVAGTLKNIVAKVKKQLLAPPAVIVVGEVVSLRDRLAWFDSRPLSGRRVLVTRARRQASALSKLLSERGAQPVELPAIAIKSIDDNKKLDRAISRLGQYQWLLFTSVNGVESFFNRLRDRGRDARALGDLKIGAIGPATADALRERGITTDYVPTVYTSEGIITGFKRMKISGRRLLLPRANIDDKELVEGLKGLGFRVDEVAVYRTVPPAAEIAAAKKLLRGGGIDIVTFTSSSTVTNLLAAFGQDLSGLKSVKVACIGPKTAATATKAELKVDIIAKESTVPGLVDAIEEYFQKEA